MQVENLVDRHILANQNLVVEFLIAVNRDMAMCPFQSEKDVLEWWLVTPYLARQLQIQGEIIVEEYGSHWWGRTTSGQAISMDGVIHTICEN